VTWFAGCFFQIHISSTSENKKSLALVYVGAMYFAWNPTNTRLHTCLQRTKANRFLVNICSSRPHHQITAVVMKTTQVSDMWHSHAFCKSLVNSNVLDLIWRFVYFVHIHESALKDDIPLKPLFLKNTDLFPFHSHSFNSVFIHSSKLAYCRKQFEFLPFWFHDVQNNVYDQLLQSEGPLFA
jgi:hypothetical protein